MASQKSFDVLASEAMERINRVARKTPLERNDELSQKYNAEIFLKREDMQLTRSYKLRGAFNKMSQLSADERKRGVVCASAGNHAQGVAYGCSALLIKGSIFMPETTPMQKINRVRSFGGENVIVHLVGKTFDEASAAAREYADKNKSVFVHPFNDMDVIAGQGTIALEILTQMEEVPDIVLVPIGGGGLISGIASVFEILSPKTRVIGVEPTGVASMHAALKAGRPITLNNIDTFVDGVAVRTVGDLTAKICKRLLKQIVKVQEGKVCETMIELYQRDGVVAEPAGALSVAALDMVASKIKNKKVVCIISGGNNDISRYPEIVERSLIYQGKKHYFIVNFAQKAGALKRFLNDVLGPSDDITLFEYVKRSNRENGPALVGIELANKEDLSTLLSRMKASGLLFEQVHGESPLFRLMI